MLATGVDPRHSSPYLAVVLLTLFSSPSAQPPHAQAESYQIEPQSRLWLKGSSTVGEFTCGTRIAKEFTVFPGRPAGGSADSILVKKLDCGNGAMNRDMYAAMKADSFPSIEYEFVRARTLPDSVSGDKAVTIKAEGMLTIAGVTRPEVMIVHLHQLAHNKFQVVGRKELSMSDFGIKPPTAFWGLIKSNNRLVVDFDIVASQTPSGSLGNLHEGGAVKRGLKGNPGAE